MLTDFSKGIFFILAYIPLIIFMEIRFASLDLLFLLTICGILFIIFIVDRTIKNLEKMNSSIEEITVTEVKNSEYLAFVITYIVPFFGFEPDIRSLIAILSFFIFLGFIYVKTSLFCLNPLLNFIWGYNLYEIVIGKNKAILLTKSDLRNGKRKLSLVKIKEDVYWGES